MSRRPNGFDFFLSLFCAAVSGLLVGTLDLQLVGLGAILFVGSTAHMAWAYVRAFDRGAQ